MAPEVNLRGYRKSSRRSAVKSSFAAKLHALLAPGPSRYSKRSQFVPPRRTKIRVKLSSAGETKVQSRGGKFETRIGYVEVQRARREIYGSRIPESMHERGRLRWPTMGIVGTRVSFATRERKPSAELNAFANAFAWFASLN